jgi:hypothetical protein
VPHLVDDGLSMLQYIDDTIIFLYHDLERARNLKVLLCTFEQLSALKLTITRVKYFVTVRLRRSRRSNPVFLDVNVVHIHLNTLESQCIIKNLAIMIRK